jgi:D-xylose 1-dehydrogenase (NADP+, D-xylono-1,5-lactone-forming)
MPEKVRWGILGGATIAASATIPAIASSRNATLVALASRTPERLSRLGASAGVERLHDRYEALLEDPSVDAVYIALPNSMHHEWSIRALRAGKHVLCEKPLAMTAVQGKEMADVSRESDRLLMEAFMYRFNRQTASFIEQFQGDARHIHVTFASQRQGADNIRLQERLGGGVLADLGCYAVDAARWLLGEPEAVHASALSESVDTTVAALLTFPGGSTATIWCSFDSGSYQELLVSTDAGSFRLGPVNGSAVGHRPFSAWMDPLETDATEPYRLMVERFSDGVLLGRPIPLPLAGSIANLDVMDRIRRSADVSTPGLPR